MDLGSNSAKADVKEFWDRAACGEELYLSSTDLSGYAEQARSRYALEPYIAKFAKFESARGLRVLEIGVGLGADHQRFAEAGAILSGIDLTPRAVEHTENRLKVFGLAADLRVGDAENLEFTDGYFDLVYSWGVLHHSPETSRAIEEVYRVLRPGGVARIMVYNKWSVVGAMLWVRYALLRLRPFEPYSKIYSKYLESPGTKAYTVDEARRLFSGFSRVDINIKLTHGDLLSSGAGRRHSGFLLNIARVVWPRWIIRKFLPRNGLFMLIEAIK